VSSRATDYDLLIGELKDTHLTVPEDTSKHEDDFYQIQRSCGTPSVTSVTLASISSAVRPKVVAGAGKTGST
jgi:hypothetical protein